MLGSTSKSERLSIFEELSSAETGRKSAMPFLSPELELGSEFGLESMSF
jgi:hypothetical protein